MRTKRILMAPALWACGAMLAASAALAACSSGGSQPAAGSPGAGQGRSPDAQTAAIIHCYRTHGDPSFPDPVYDPSDGRWHFDAMSPGSAPESTQQACRHLFPSVNASPPVPLAQFQQLVRLAQCIRQHGVPTWPDPDPDGSFPLPPSIQKGRVTSVAMTACQRYMPSGGIDAHAVP